MLQHNNGVTEPNQSYKDTIISQSSILEEVTEQLGRGNVPDMITEITGEMLRQSEEKEIPCLIQGLLQQTGLACLAGSSDTGKSSILRQLAVSIVTNQDHFLGFRINPKHKSVIYVSTEDLQRETAYLLRRQTENFLPESLRDLRFIFDTHNLLSEIDQRLTRKPADLVVVDCFADVFGGDLKDTQKIRSYLQPFQDLAQKHQCLFLFLHHTGKRTENGEPSKNNLLSGQGFEAKMRLVIELRVDPVDTRLRHLCIVKGNYLPSSSKRESFVLVFDESKFLFTTTHQRVPFEMLIKRIDNDDTKQKYQQALDLKAKGLNYDQIAERLGYSSKGTVSKLLDKGQKNDWGKVVSFGNYGNEVETEP